MTTTQSQKEEEDVSEEIRLLFDQNEPKVIKEFEFPNNISVKVVCAQQSQPGALQSGIYLWPAATALGKFLCEDFTINEWCNVVELGAGCGLSGLVAARLIELIRKHGQVTFTDRDWTSLRMIKDSIQACDRFGGMVEIKRKKLLWTEQKVEGETEFDANVDLIIGSDLVYSTESAEALFSTVSRKTLSNIMRWRFVLSSSFRDPETTQIIEGLCAKLNMKRAVRFEDYDKCLIEEYTRA